MIKALAALFMLIDHVGAILFPQVAVLRVIGRLSMPLFAYCIARGFHCSEQKGTTVKYARNLAVFAVISQVPFAVWNQGLFPLNIGFTWLLALCLMKAVTVAVLPPSANGGPKQSFLFMARPVYRLVVIAFITVMILTAVFVPMDYGLYGVLFPGVFYLFLFRMNRPKYAVVGMTALFAVFVLMGGGATQVFALAAFPVLLLARRYDDKIKLPGKFFYWFYPAHIAVLLLLEAVFK